MALGRINPARFAAGFGSHCLQCFVWRRLSLLYVKAAIIGPAGGRSFANLLRFWGGSGEEELIAGA